MQTQRDAFLNFERLNTREYCEPQWSAKIPHGVSLEAIQKPIYWKHFAKQIKPGDLIIALWEDLSQEAEFRVRSVNDQEVHVALRLHKSYQSSAPVKSHAYEIKWRGPNGKDGKWGIVRKDSGDLIKGGFDSEDQAQEYFQANMMEAAA